MHCPASGASGPRPAVPCAVAIDLTGAATMSGRVVARWAALCGFQIIPVDCCDFQGQCAFGHSFAMSGRLTFLSCPGYQHVCSQVSAARQSSWCSFRLFLFQWICICLWIYIMIILYFAQFVNLLRASKPLCNELFTSAPRSKAAGKTASTGLGRVGRPRAAAAIDIYVHR